MTQQQTMTESAPAPADAARTVILLRHGRSTANTAGVLAGRGADIHLDEHGRGQAEAVAQRLAGITLARIISSPLERCLETVGPLAAATGLAVEIESDVIEVDYGSWTGRALRDLASEELWKIVQRHASAAVFPDGEALAAVSSRAVSAVRRQLKLTSSSGVLLVCAHGDVIKSILADALGMHLDAFQRIHVSPASLSVIRYTATGTVVERVNDSGDLTALLAAPAADGTAEQTPEQLRSSDAVVGGGSR